MNDIEQRIDHVSTLSLDLLIELYEDIVKENRSKMTTYLKLKKLFSKLHVNINDSMLIQNDKNELLERVDDITNNDLIKMLLKIKTLDEYRVTVAKSIIEKDNDEDDDLYRCDTLPIKIQDDIRMMLNNEFDCDIIIES